MSRVGVAAPRIPRFTGGAQRLWQLASGLVVKGHDVTYFRTDGETPEARHFLDGRVTVRPIRSIMQADLDVLFFGHPGLKHLMDHPARKVWMMQGLNAPDEPFVRSEKTVNLANASWLFRRAQELSPKGLSCLAAGGVDTRLFQATSLQPGNPVGSRPRTGTWPDIRPLYVPFPIQELRGIHWKDRPAFYQRCSAFLSHDVATAGWCNPVAEAMACGRPVLSNRVGAVEDLIVSPDVGHVYEDFQDAKEKLKEWRSNPRRMREVGENARSWVTRFSWDRWVASVDRLIRQNLVLDNSLKSQDL